MKDVFFALLCAAAILTIAVQDDRALRGESGASKRPAPVAMR